MNRQKILQLFLESKVRLMEEPEMLDFGQLPSDERVIDDVSDVPRKKKAFRIFKHRGQELTGNLHRESVIKQAQNDFDRFFAKQFLEVIENTQNVSLVRKSGRDLDKWLKEKLKDFLFKVKERIQRKQITRSFTDTLKIHIDFEDPEYWTETAEAIYDKFGERFTEKVNEKRSGRLPKAEPTLSKNQLKKKKKKKRRK